MENLMDYVCMGLLFGVYVFTMAVDCERFEGLDMSEVRQGLAKTFLRMRRARVEAGQWLLLVCSARMVIWMVGIPLVNVFCMLVQSDVRYRMVLATEGEQWVVSGLCLLLLILYMVERKMKRRMMEEWEEGNE